MQSEDKRKQQLEWLDTHLPPRKDETGPRDGKSGGKRTHSKRIGRDSGKGKSLPRWEMPVDEEIDLHGMAVDEAMAKVESALEGYRRRPGVRLRVIHGQSSGSKVSIKGNLHRLLAGAWKKHIRSFRLEPGNAGSTVLILEDGK